MYVAYNMYKYGIYMYIVYMYMYTMHTALCALHDQQGGTKTLKICNTCICTNMVYTCTCM